MLSEDRNWILEGVCRDRGPDLYDLDNYPTSTSKAAKNMARRACAGCPAHVVRKCAQEALDIGDEGVVRAGIQLIHGNTKRNRRMLLEVLGRAGELPVTDIEREADQKRRAEQREYQLRRRWADKTCRFCKVPLRPAGSEPDDWESRSEAVGRRWICVSCAELHEDQIGA